MDDGSQDLQQLSQLLRQYFVGLYEGDVALLRDVFHADVVLKAPDLRLNREQWLTAVAKRDKPKQIGQPFNFKILSIEVVGEQAMAKVQCPLLDKFYIDFLGFLKEQGRWQIVSKMYVNQGS